MIVRLERVERLMVLLPITTRLLDLPVSVRTGAEDEAFDEPGTTVSVATCEVMVLPDLSVVVTGTEVRMVEDAVSTAAADESESVLDCALLDDASLEDALLEGGVLDGASLELSALLVTPPAATVVDVVLASVLLGVVAGSLVLVGSLLVGVVVLAAVDEGVSVDVGVSVDNGVVVSLVSLDSLVVVGASEVLVVTPVPTACLLFGMMPSWTVSARICAKPRTGKRENMLGDM